MAKCVRIKRRHDTVKDLAACEKLYRKATDYPRWPTGMVDSNGRPIRHGDIVKVHRSDCAGNPLICEVVVDVTNPNVILGIDHSNSAYITGSIYNSKN